MKKKILLIAMMFMLCSFTTLPTYNEVRSQVEKGIVVALDEYRTYGLQMNGVQLPGRTYKIYDQDSLYFFKRAFGGKFYVTKVRYYDEQD